ncbi:MarR family winged helix-turn-helix transcriptional regulator [Mycobacterium sp. E1747]|uniref:MarR family winged helix-turn-helix transcriptional regulator n=1 Tax=Mycobacterium sp. E1747 TaxID=1834128 RepID=UPI0007FBB233|nr:MarR family transcriptional regulator [Mycobacterium sp. E1747]OBH13572.1 MarR family transcriptional regulator [Mycobacterium sp. E1747]
MPSKSSRPGEVQELDYLSFVDYAVDVVGERLEYIDVGAMRLGLSLHRLTSSLIYDWESRVHRPRGWTWAGFRVLFTLWVVGPLGAKRIAELSGMSRAAVSSLLNTLVRDGLVSRETAADDRRGVVVALTPAGRKAIRAAFVEHNKREQAWVESLTPAERQTLQKLLNKLIRGTAAANVRRRS